MLRSISVRRSPIHGNGVFAARDLPAGKTLIEYRGKLCTHDEADEIYGGSAETGHTFLFTLNDEYLVDANRRGNAARWINHSCDPNCEAVIIEEGRNGHKRERIWIETRRAIRKGEELTYDYGIKLDVRHTERMRKLWACRCGTPRCIGTMLKPKKKKRQPAARGR